MTDTPCPSIWKDWSRMPRHAVPLPFEGRGQGWGIATKSNIADYQWHATPPPAPPLKLMGGEPCAQVYCLNSLTPKLPNSLWISYTPFNLQNLNYINKDCRTSRSRWHLFDDRYSLLFASQYMGAGYQSSRLALLFTASERFLGRFGKNVMPVTRSTWRMLLTYRLFLPFSPLLRQMKPMPLGVLPFRQTITLKKASGTTTLLAPIVACCCQKRMGPQTIYTSPYFSAHRRHDISIWFQEPVLRSLCWGQQFV